MRTTVTIDDDLAVLLEKKRRATGATFKDVLNEALRDGLLHDVPAQKDRRERFRTKPLPLGEPLLDDLTDTGEVLSYLDGERSR
ncbi:hypothetical protein SAMN05216266_101362 [Amycolatopsis marina]|uniref:Uncharacterized protein n=1 Tax=Amycolatopsis marina TaxID=490629 RepID=A0A1I0VN03_9PSEU|nr:hypothetical protein [Amycolatopsis marina]SFA77691.1 hypothetical protein SAMN05216266_101362 [Amycolatopsis marina]